MLSLNARKQKRPVKDFAFTQVNWDTAKHAQVNILFDKHSFSCWYIPLQIYLYSTLGLRTTHTTGVQPGNINQPQKAQIYQNQPNPFSNQTMISYFIPNEVQTAYLQIQDVNGQLIKHIEIDHRGNGQIELTTALLSKGSYSYTLIIDGQILGTKQMILTD